MHKNPALPWVAALAAFFAVISLSLAAFMIGLLIAFGVLIFLIRLQGGKDLDRSLRDSVIAVLAAVILILAFAFNVRLGLLVLVFGAAGVVVSGHRRERSQ